MKYWRDGKDIFCSLPIYNYKPVLIRFFSIRVYICSETNSGGLWASGCNPGRAKRDSLAFVSLLFISIADPDPTAEQVKKED